MCFYVRYSDYSIVDKNGMIMMFSLIDLFDNPLFSPVFKINNAAD